MVTPFPDNFLLTGSHCLFLDVDGTLLEFATDRGDVVADKGLIALLKRLERACFGALALISGRPIAELDQLFFPLYLPVAGIHGYERRNAMGEWFRESAENVALHAVREGIDECLRMLPGCHAEDKQFAIAVHYRAVPQLEDRLRLRLSHLLAGHGATLELLEGNHVIEIKPSSWNKATAVEAFMKEIPFAGRTPIYLGDDVTDLHGFEAVRRFGGHSIAVGDRLRTPFRIENPPQVREWLSNVLPIIQ